MPRLTIDGKEIEFAPGTTVIRAAAESGITIPHYCWHPGLTVAGNCRMCLVEIEKMPKLSIACSTLCAEGMVVRTANDRVREARDAIMEFLLINHPLDCPICDQAGECRLQQYSYRYGQGGSRFLEEKVHKPKNVDLGPHIVFDAERCILCTRCVRFCQEVSGTNELAVGLRGDHAIIETFPGRELDNPYSGNTVDLCPVGALTLKEFRFRSRVWFLRDTPSVCPGCARGCSITIGSKEEAILRYVPRENPQVNQWWMCDEGRLSWRSLEAGERIKYPAVRGAAQGASAGAGPHAGAGSSTGARVPLSAGSSTAARVPLSAGSSPASGEIERTTWASALDLAASRLLSLSERHGTGAVALLASPRATNEDLFLAASLARHALAKTPAASESSAGASETAGRSSAGASRAPSESSAGTSGTPGESSLGASGTPGESSADRAAEFPVFLARHERGTDDELLIRKDKSPNDRGAREIFAAVLGAARGPGAGAPRGGSLGISGGAAELTDAIRSGKIKALVMIGPTLTGFEPEPLLDGAALAMLECLILLDCFATPALDRAHVVLPAHAFGEDEGTYTNFQGQVQRVRAAVPPHADARPTWRILQDLAHRLGATEVPQHSGPQAVFAALAREVPAFGGLSYAALGPHGARLVIEEHVR